MPTGSGDPGGPHGPGERVERSERYGLVLLLLVASFLLSAFLPQGRIQVLPRLLYLAALALALHPGMRSRQYWWMITVVSAGTVVLDVVVRHRVASGLVSLWLAVILALTIVVVVRRILVHRVVTAQTILVP